MAVGSTKVVQVTNIAPQATKDQMQTLFGFLGKIEDIRLYPTIRDVSCPVQSRICYIKFMESSTVNVAEHMTNTVFIDRALIVIPVQNGDIPDEYYALEMTRNGTVVPGFNVSEPKLPPHVTNSVQGSGSEAVMITTDPNLEVNNLPLYPPLPLSFDSIKVEETRRTVMAVNVAESITLEELIEFFTKAGEVKYLRHCETPSDGGKHVLIEFTDQASVIPALKLSGQEFKDHKIEIVHATQPIVKPQAKSNEAAQKEIEEAMSRFKEAQNMISASIEPVIGLLTKDKRSSRRSRSRSRGRRRRSRSRSHSRSRRGRRSSSRARKTSRSRDRKKRSKSRSRKRSRTRSRSKGSKTRRSRSKSVKRPSRHRSKSRDKDKDKDKDKERDRKSRDKSRDRKRDKEPKSRDKDKDRDKDKEASSSKSSSSRDNKSSRRSRDRDRDRERERDKDRDKDKDKDKEKKSDKESSIDSLTVEKKKSRSRSRSRRRSRSREVRKKDKERKRSRSRDRDRRRRTPSPRPPKKRSRSRSRDRSSRRDKRDRDRREKRARTRSRSRSKVPRNYDEEEKGFDSEKEKSREQDSNNEKDSSEKSDNMDISNSP